MEFSWKAGTAVALAGATIGLGGCVEFEGPIQGKQISDDEVRVKFKICDDSSSQCNPEPMERQRGVNQTRVLIAIRTPKGTDVPKDFAPKGIDVLFEGSGSYAAELNSKAPHDGDEKWHGYISQDISSVEKDQAKFKLTLGLPKDAGNSFKFRPVVGYVDGGPTDTVTCAEDPRDSFDDGDTEFVCIDDPATNREIRKSVKIELD